jgi:hypothetical protein
MFKRRMGLSGVFQLEQQKGLVGKIARDEVAVAGDENKPDVGPIRCWL